MDGSPEPGRAREEGPRSADRKGSPRQRADAGSPAAGGSAGRPAQDSRRRRGADLRYAGWGDGMERAYCSHAAHQLPATFPVESHGGTATIVAAVVAQRPESLLLCTFSHFGPHAWPDGEVVEYLS